MTFELEGGKKIVLDAEQASVVPGTSWQPSGPVQLAVLVVFFALLPGLLASLPGSCEHLNHAEVTRSRPGEMGPLYCGSTASSSTDPRTFAKPRTLHRLRMARAVRA